MDKLIKLLKDSKQVDISLIPSNPKIQYYNDKDIIICESDSELVFNAIRLMIASNKLSGYYCMIESEWADSYGEFQGDDGYRHYLKYQINPDGTMVDYWPKEVFSFSKRCIEEIDKLKNK